VTMACMRWSVFVAGGLLCATGWAQSPTCNITSPANSAVISGLAFLIAGSVTNAPSARSIEVIFDGDSQGIVWLQPGQQNWSMNWNTNFRFDTPGDGWITVNVLDSSGTQICTSTNTGITIQNAFRFTYSQIHMTGTTVSAVSGGTCTGTTWTGECQIAGNFGGTNAGTDTINVYTTVDGDGRWLSAPFQTAKILQTAWWPNGLHNVCAYAWDSTIGGLPVGEVCQQITFANSTAHAEMLINHNNWTIPANGSIQLNCSLLNADGSSGGACSSPTWDTVDVTTVTLASPHSTRVCSVSATGLVSATAGINYGLCVVTVTLNGYQQRVIYGQVNNSNGPIPHFGTDGQIHTTMTGATDSFWVSSMFSTGGIFTGANPGFSDSLIQNNLAFLGTPLNQAGFNTIEPSAVSGPGDYSTTLANFQNALNTNIAQYSSYASTFNLYYHINMTNSLGCAGAGSATYPNADAFWNLVEGTGSTFMTVATAQLAASWQATGRLMGITTKDELEAAGPIVYPNPVGTIGAAGGPTNIVIDGSGNATVNWPAPAGDFVGAAYPSCSRKIRISGTGTGLDNGTSPFAYPLTGVNPNGTQIYFSAPITSTTITSGTINAFAYLNEDGAGSFIPNNAWSTFMSGIRTANPHPMVGNPVSANQSYGNNVLGPQWCGDPSNSDFCEVYVSYNYVGNLSMGPQANVLSQAMNLQPGSFAQATISNFSNRAMPGNSGSQRAFLAYSGASQYNYNIQQPATAAISGVTCSGDTCTWPSDHGIRNVPSGCAMELVISGSSDPDWNGIFCVVQAPTSTTLRVAKKYYTDLAVDATTNTKVTSTSRGFVAGDVNRYVVVFNGNGFTTGSYQINSVSGGAATLASSPAALHTTGGYFYVSSYAATANKTDGTINWASGATASVSSLTLNGQQIIKTVDDNCVHRGEDFTVSGGSTGGTFWTNTKFYNRAWPVPLPNNYCASHGYQDIWLPYLPAGEASGTISVALYPDAEFHRGLYQGVGGEGIGGPVFPAWEMMEGAVSRSTGYRLYPNVSLNFSYVPYGLWGQTFTSIGPLYNNGDGGMIPGFWAFAPGQLLFERLATSGYLYGTPAPNGCPDLGFLYDCDLRSASKGNLLMFLSAAAVPTTRTIDISGCAVSGQPTVKYAVDTTGLVISTIPANSTTDTNATIPGGGMLIYLCSNNEAAEYTPPTISVRLQDIPGAASVVVHYSLVPYLLNQNTAGNMNCGTGTCTIPWDPKIGPLYYRLTYLDGNGAVIASSDVQSL
jgi:hypothetical protein